MNIKTYLLPAMIAAVDAGHAIMEVYSQADFGVEEKSDKSPLTLADKRAHETIVAHLSGFGIPILSEEGRAIDYETRRQWPYMWMVDPLDGTKEFIKRNGEFTVNIALVHDHQSVLGVIYVPVFHRLYFAVRDFGAYAATVTDAEMLKKCALDEIIHTSERLSVKIAGKDPFTIVGSRSHATPELEAYVEKKRSELGDVEFISAGSSLKICQVAEGKADVYPRLGPTMEWDTAAGHAIAESAGALVFRSDTGGPMLYNKENLLNPWFFVSNGNH
ncbi:MAG: 3'(2'),5'-bisphosphate nucleotidase CysQ [Desulfosalsimonadaceae bacterium]|nr:3'(2'),5'-bisphosphate nucleotidase CysQ [Desulfosalsimonadaceae bacterium]